MRLVPYCRNEMQLRPFPEVSRLFENPFNDTPALSSFLSRTEGWIPAVDILEKDGNLVLRAELPGVTEKDIELKLEGRVLTIKGERKFEAEEAKQNYHRIESSYGSFTRSFTLPDTVDTDKIKADFKNGILSVTIPQKPEVRPREIPVSIS